MAEEFGLSVTGTIGVIIEAKRCGHVQSIKPILEKIQKTNFRITPEFVMLALHLAGEEYE